MKNFHNNILKICTFLFVIMGPIYSFSQTTWKEDMKNENANFFETQQKFEDYWKNKEIGKGKGWKPFKRWESFLEPRVNSNGIFPGHMLFQEWQKIKNQARSSTSIEADWYAYGPNDVPLQNNGNKRGIGRINTVNFNPQNPNEIWVGAASGGLWKSIDGGLNWTSNTDLLPNLGVSDIAIDPINNDIMYIATGDRDGGDTYAYGVLKSIDGGETWNTTGLSFEINYSYRANRILIHPNNTNILIVSTKKSGYGETYRSTDAGETWEMVLEGPNFISMEFKIDNPNIIFAATTGNCKYYKSSDNGITWTNNTSPAGLPNSGKNRGLIATTEANPNVVYLLYSANDDGYGGLYKSTDAGLTFNLQSDSPNIMGWDYDGSDEGGQGWYDLALAVSPTNENTVFVGGVNCWKSSNGGVDWDISSHWFGQGGSYMHADEHILKYNTSNGVLYSGNDGGLYKSEDDGINWTDISDGLQISQFYKIGISQTNQNLLLAGSQDNGTLRANTLNSWDAVRGGDGMECAIDPTDENTMYSTVYYGEIDISTNGGNNWQNISPSEDGEWITPFQIDQNNPNRIVAGYEYLYESYDKGNNWNVISNTFNNGTIDKVVLSNTNEDVIYVAESSKLYKTIDGGENWISISSGLPSRTITSIALHSSDDNKIWVTFSGYGEDDKVYSSVDGGENYTNISANLPNLPVNCATFFIASETIFIGTDVGVWYSDSSMTDWAYFNQGLPNVIVNELEIQTNSNKMFAATYGRGVWVTNLPATAPPTANFNFSVTNECSGVVTFQSNSIGASNIDWDFGDNSNSNENIISHQYLTSGTYTVTLTANNSLGSEVVSQNITLDILTPPTTTSAENCTAGSVILSASSNNLSSEIHWHDAPSNGNLLYIGENYNTDVLNSTTTFYASSTEYSDSGNVGEMVHTGDSDYSGGENSVGSLQFDATENFILQSIDVFTNQAGERKIILIDENGTIIQEHTEFVPISDNNPYTITLNFKIEVGNNYRLTTDNSISTANFGGDNPQFKRSSSDALSFPYNFDDALSITHSYWYGNGNGGEVITDYYYYFYNWKVKKVCSSPAMPVTANIGSNEPLELNINNGCTYDSINLVASGNFDSYIWDNESTEDNITIFDAGTYSVTAFDAEGCVAFQTIEIPSINTFEISTGNQSFCEGNPVYLQCASNLASYNWSTGETSSSISVSESGNYSIVAIDQNGCSLTSEITLSLNETNQVVITNVEESDVYCRNDEIELSAGGSNNYVWQNSVGGADYSQQLLVNGMQTFTVMASDINNCQSSESVTIEVIDCSTSIANENSLSNVIVFPNPTNNSFTLFHKGIEDEIKSIQLYDIRNRLIENRRTTYSNGQITEKFDIEGLTKGVYLLKISSKSISIVKKVILE